MIVDGTPYCDVCGSDGSNREDGLRIDFGKTEELSVLCSSCKGLMDAGLVRLDGIDENGRRRFRRWHMEWFEGDLIPLPKPGLPVPHA